MATNINFVWRPFYNFRSPNGDFKKTLSLKHCIDMFTQILMKLLPWP